MNNTSSKNSIEYVDGKSIFRDRYFIIRVTIFNSDPIYPYPLEIIEKSDVSHQIETILSNALSRRSDVVRLRFIPIEALPKIESLVLPLGGVIKIHRASSVTISKFWSSSALGMASRKGLKRKFRNLQNEGIIQFEEVKEPKERLKACGQMLDWKFQWLNSRRQIAFGFRDPFFQKSIYSSFSGNDSSKYRIFSLAMGKKAIAYEFCIHENQRLMSIIASFDRNYARFSPGRILSTLILEASQQLGFNKYDLLPPETDFKKSLANTSEEVLEIIIPRTMVGRSLMWIAEKCGKI
ncbi:GNAT family N-acetyltransferase [Agrobacterium sp. 22-211-1]